MGMKKLLAVLFSALLLVGVAGCGGNNAQQGAVTQKVMNAKTKQDFEPVTEIKEGRKNVYAVLKVIRVTIGRMLSVALRTEQLRLTLTFMSAAL